MYSKILLTVDGSRLARAAIPHAAELARGSDCEVLVFHVIEPLAVTRLAVLPAAYESGRSLEEVAAGDHYLQERDAKAEVDQAVEQLKAAGVQNVRGVVREGMAGNAILDFAIDEGVGAVVMATRGHSGLGREVTGSVAEYVLRHAGPVAVVLVGPRGG